MKKKIFVLISLVGISFSNIFAYNIGNIKNIYIHKLNIIEKHIEEKYKEQSKVCYYKKNIYKRIDKALNLYKQKHPKYKIIFNILLEIDNYKEIQIKNKCDRPILKQNINNHSNNLNQNNTKTLKSQINKINYNYNWKIILNNPTKNITLPKIWKIDNIYNSFIIQVNKHWIGLKKLLTINISKDRLENAIKYAKQKYNPDFIFYKNIDNKYKIYLVYKENINIIDPFDPLQTIDYNVNQLQKAWYLYINSFFYKNTNKKNTVIWWLFKYNDKLYYMIASWDWEYYKIEKKDIVKNIMSIKNWTIITNQWNNFIVRKKGIKIFYLWNFDIYKNIDLETFWKIIDFTFYTISKYNLPYNVQNMYNLINFTKQFNGKSLKDTYKRIILNYKYNKNINNILNKKWMNQETISKKVNSNKTLIQNWNIFYSLTHKEWVCQTISDIFSLIALFNWQKADTVIWTSKSWYLHQISKIKDRYYDPTFDLDNDKNISHFNISKWEVEKYINLENK